MDPTMRDPRNGKRSWLRPHDYAAADPASRRNRAVVDRFEPGSTMKMFTVATALAQKTISPTETIYCEAATCRSTTSSSTTPTYTSG